MPIKQLHEFTVEGSGAFPFDMLRYDQCWPKTEGDDSVEIERTTRRDHRGAAQVTLVGLNQPTSGRWQSFGWQIINQSKRSV